MSRALALLALALAVPTAAPAALSPTLANGGASALKAGQFLWDESDAGAGPLAIMVSVDQQHLYVYRGSRLIGVSTVSTGKPGKKTPMGEFRILQKNVFHRSNLYSNAPMPFMQRLTWDGIAIHGGHLPGYPASHGCIRVPLAFAKKLFAATDMGDIVSVSDGQSGPFLRVEVDYAALATDGNPTWTERGREVQLAMASPRPLPVADVARPVTAAPAPAPDLQVRVSSKIDVEKPAALKPDVVKASAAPRDPTKPHWLIPYFESSATGSVR